MSLPSPSTANRVSFSINEALSSALDDIERSGVLVGIPPPMKRVVRLAFEESIYALADYAVQTGEVPPAFRFEVVEADPRGDAAEQEMALINAALAKAGKAAEGS
jgi:hypothetical protein